MLDGIPYDFYQCIELLLSLFAIMLTLLMFRLKTRFLQLDFFWAQGMLCLVLTPLKLKLLLL